MSPTTGVARHAAGDDVQIVFHGELYGPGADDPARYCLEAYLAADLGFLPSLHGSFALAVLDPRVERVRLVTDPINSRKLFLTGDDEVTWISTMHAFQGLPVAATPDLAGLAHCLVNGAPLNGRTAFEDVRVLDRASVHEIRPGGTESQPYWHYVPDPAVDRSDDRCREDLRDAILAAVERRLPAQGGSCVSLSGGYDSAAVLGALKHLSAPEVTCFTYRKPKEPDRGDVRVARQMAEAAGYDHATLEAYTDAPETVVAENVRWGHGMPRLVVETDTWRQLRESTVGGHCSSIWVADECMGMVPPYTLRDGVDVLDSLSIARLSRIGSIREVFTPSVRDALDEALREDLGSMMRRNDAISDPYNLRDYLYLDQRLPRLLSWREAFAGQCGEVRNALLDRELLELQQRLPRHLAQNKRLFRVTAREAFPELFAMERAVAGPWHAGRWCRDVLTHQPGLLTQMILRYPSPLDPYLPPDRLVRLVARESGLSGRVRRLTRRGQRIRVQARRRARKLLDGPGVIRPRQRVVDPAVFIMRAITLRELFRRRSAEGGAGR